jgi:Protein of unknown function (DUF2786)
MSAMGTTDVLARVRALLAKAESTAYDAEAEAFTAKAQELIARYRIDRALVDASARHREQVGVRRIDIPNPYARTKVLLLSSVANANDCRTVYMPGIKSAQLFGRDDDRAMVEELYTSLLVQATAAMHRAGPKHDPFGRSRTRSFRHAFLVAFAARIGVRLRDTVAATVDAVAAETGTALVPLLAARGDAAETAARAEFPMLRNFNTTVSDPEGMHAGSVFADQVDISVHRKIARPA